MTIEKLEKLKFTDIDKSILKKLPNCEDGSELADMVVYANKIGWNDAIDTIIDELKTADISEWIDNASTVERSPGEWIPIKYRPLTEDERIAFARYTGVEYCDTADEKAFDCPMPEDGQEILISTSWGVVEDVADNDIDGEGFICYGLENHGDWDGVDAWMPKPEAYKETENEDRN